MFISAVLLTAGLLASPAAIAQGVCGVDTVQVAALTYPSGEKGKVYGVCLSPVDSGTKQATTVSCFLVDSGNLRNPPEQAFVFKEDSQRSFTKERGDEVRAFWDLLLGVLKAPKLPSRIDSVPCEYMLARALVRACESKSASSLDGALMRPTIGFHWPSWTTKTEGGDHESVDSALLKVNSTCIIQWIQNLTRRAGIPNFGAEIRYHRNEDPFPVSLQSANKSTIGISFINPVVPPNIDEIRSAFGGLNKTGPDYGEVPKGSTDTGKQGGNTTQVPKGRDAGFVAPPPPPAVPPPSPGPSDILSRIIISYRAFVQGLIVFISIVILFVIGFFVLRYRENIKSFLGRVIRPIGKRKKDPSIESLLRVDRLLLMIPAGDPHTDFYNRMTGFAAVLNRLDDNPDEHSQVPVDLRESVNKIKKENPSYGRRIEKILRNPFFRLAYAYVSVIDKAAPQIESLNVNDKKLTTAGENIEKPVPTCEVTTQDREKNLKVIAETTQQPSGKRWKSGTELLLENIIEHTKEAKDLSETVKDKVDEVQTTLKDFSMLPDQVIKKIEERFGKLKDTLQDTFQKDVKKAVEVAELERDQYKNKIQNLANEIERREEEIGKWRDLAAELQGTWAIEPTTDPNMSALAFRSKYVFQSNRPVADLCSWARRLGQRIVGVNKLLIAHSDNRELQMVKYLADWDQIKNELEALPTDWTLKPLEKFHPTQHTEEVTNEQFWEAFRRNWSSFQRILIAAARLEAYVQPLLSVGEEALPARLLMVALQATAADLATVMLIHGASTADIRILSSVPKEVEVDRKRPESFLISLGFRVPLPLNQMHALIVERAKGTDQEVVTDIIQWGWTLNGLRQCKSITTVYQENTWLTAVEHLNG